MQHQCPTCSTYYIYDSITAVAIDEYGECINCLIDHKKNFSAQMLHAKAMERKALEKSTRDEHDWRNVKKN